MSTRGKPLDIQRKFSYSKIGITFLEPPKFYATTNRFNPFNGPSEAYSL